MHFDHWWDTHIPRGGEKAFPHQWPIGLGARSREAVATRKLGGCEASCERRRDACSTHQCFKCIQFKVCRYVNGIALLQFQRKSDSKVDMTRYVCLILLGKVWRWNEHQTSSNDHLSRPYFLDLQAERSELATQSEIAHGALAALALEKKDQWKLCHNLTNSCTFYNVTNMYHHFSHFSLPLSLSFFEISCAHGWLPVYV